MQIPTHNITRQKGFSLIEALVAFLVLSVGMLGIASLQTMSIRAGHTASLRSVAVVKVEEIFERMRSNQSVLSAYVSATSDPGTNNGCDDLAGPVVSCGGDPVEQAKMARYDVFQWKQGLSEALPANIATTGSIVVDSPVTPGAALSTVTVTVNWQERDTETPGMVNMSYSAIAKICGAPSC